MKNFFLLLCVSLLSPLTQAKDTGNAEIDTSVYELKDFRAAGLQVTSKELAEDEVPTQEKRDSAFSKVAGLSGDIDGWDPLDLDLLYVRARSLSEKEMRDTYPKISDKKLNALRSYIASHP